MARAIKCDFCGGFDATGFKSWTSSDYRSALGGAVGTAVKLDVTLRFSGSTFFDLCGKCRDTLLREFIAELQAIAAP